MALTDSLKTLLIKTTKSLKVSARREGVSQGWMRCAMNLLYQLAHDKLGGLRTSTEVVRYFLDDERGRCPSRREEAMNTPLFVVLFDVESVGRQVIREVIGTAADILYLPDVEATARAEVLRRATVILAQNTAKELTPDELALIHQVRLLQFYTAGVDFIPLQALPADLPIAANRGASAEPMAEHALALTLAAVKRLFFEHRQLATGAFNQFTPNRMLAGRVCGLFGFGGIGVATARLMRAMGMQIHAINRRGHSAEPTDWIGHPGAARRVAPRGGRVGHRGSAHARDAGAHWRAGAGPHEGRRHPGESGAGRDHRGRRAVCPPATASRVHRVPRCLVGRAGAARGVSDAVPVPGAAQCDRLAA